MNLGLQNTSQSPTQEKTLHKREKLCFPTQTRFEMNQQKIKRKPKENYHSEKNAQKVDEPLKNKE
jgi:hypothetical protein